ncbi:MAG: SH3 domain-containing protein [Chloroflexota bacterium]
MHRLLTLLICFLIILITACTSEPSAAVIELDSGAIPSVTPRIVFVTPTQEPTPLSTVSIPTVAPTLAPMIPTGTPDLVEAENQCLATLETLYTQASESCIGEPSGFFCNGGLAPEAEPSGNVINVSGAMAQLGSLIPVESVASAQTPPLLTNDSGGVMWFRIAEPIQINALMLGQVEIRDVTPAGSNLDAWQSISVETRDITTETRSCSDQPYSTFVIQGPWGQSTSFALNGVSVQLTGSLAIQTTATETFYISIEGQSLLTVFGQNTLIVAGQQLRVPHAQGNFALPSGVPSAPEMLNYGRIAQIPAPLLDRPILLPQPGFARTDGRVNMRSLPTTNSRILAQVPDEQLLSIIGMNPERTWYHVRLPNGDSGWMRSDLVIGDIGDIALTYAETPAPPERYGDASHGAVVIAPQGANLRNAPDVQFELIEVLPPDSEVEILARSPYSPFVKVRTSTGEGWLALITIETTTVIQFLPVDYDVPLPPGPTPTPFFAFGGGHAYPDPRLGN